jgi:hypothetical protein
MLWHKSHRYSRQFKGKPLSKVAILRSQTTRAQDDKASPGCAWKSSRLRAGDGRDKVWLADGFGGEAEGFHDGVVDGGAHLGDFVILARGIDAIRKQDDK